MQVTSSIKSAVREFRRALQRNDFQISNPYFVDQKNQFVGEPI